MTTKKGVKVSNFTHNMQGYFTTHRNAIWHISALVLLAFGIIARICFYVNHKDLWLDEASLAFCVYGVPLKDIFFQPLPNLQAAPLGFLLFSKGLGKIFGYSEYVLYFLPLMCGIGSLILSMLIGKKLAGNFGGFIFLLLLVGSQNLLYYTTEFKQYGVEAFCSFLLLYLYVIANSTKGNPKSFVGFYIACMICIVFANTAIFIATAIGVGILYQNRNNLAAFLKTNAVWILGVGIFFVLYYVFYLKFQRVDGFYTYWEKHFLPLSLNAYPEFIEEILSILSSFTPLKAKYVWLYIIIWLIGICIAFKERKDIFIICVTAISLYILLSLFRIYPFGHGGVIGSRLSLYMSPIFYLPCCHMFICCIKRGMTLRIVMSIIIVSLCYKTFLNYKHTYPNGLFIEQTHALITQANEHYELGDLILVYNGMNPAYKYYSLIDSISNPYKNFSDDLKEVENIIQASNAKNIYILGSHYPGKKWLRSLENLSLKFDENTNFSYGVGGWGSFLIEINKSS